MSPARGLFAIVLTLLLASPLPFGRASAQDVPDNTLTIIDPMGDVDMSIASKAAPQHVNASQYGNGQFDHLDITKLEFGAETAKTFTVTMALKVLDVPANARPNRYVAFSYGRVDWRLTLGGCALPGQPAPPPPLGCLGFRDASSSAYRNVRSIQGTRAGDGFVYVIDKEAIFNENRVPARFGESLRNISAIATQYYAGGGGTNQVDPSGGAYAIDRAPQDYVSMKAFEFVQGSGGRGHLGLSTPDPIRVTNGEATTIVYKVDLFNHGDAPYSVQVEAHDIQPDWSVRTPSLLKVPAGGKVSFPVILSLPFRHEHGKTVLFSVQASAVEDPNSVAVADLGVFWTDVPQPSAHHECLSDETCGQWFHSAPLDNPLPDQTDTAAPFKNYWFNGIAKDPNPSADDANIPAFFNDEFLCALPPNVQGCKTPPVWTASWFFPMSPQLLIGLDFDLSRPGLAKLSFNPSAPDTAAKVEVALSYCDPSKQTGTAQGNPFGGNQTCYQYSQVLAKGTGTVSVSANTVAYIEIPMPIDPFADLVPYKRGANIGFSIKVTTTVPENTIVVPPRIEFIPTKSHLHLPLIEYHDPIDESFEEVGVIRFESTDPVEKLVNPGKTTLFHFNLANKDDTLHHLGLEVQGIHTEWASFVGPKVVALGPGQNTTVVLAVTAPDDAPDSDRAELFAVAQSQDEPWIVALARLRAKVVTSPDIADESAQIPGAKSAAQGSPGFEGVLLGAVLVAVAVWADRRRWS